MVALILAVVTYCRAFFLPRHRLALEAAALRQQLTVLKRKQPRPRLRHLDRLFWMALRRWWPDWATALFVVQADIVVSWHRLGFRLFWRRRSRQRGRPKVSEEIRQLIRCMKSENPSWGAPRIHGELLQLDATARCANSRREHIPSACARSLPESGFRVGPDTPPPRYGGVTACDRTRPRPGAKTPSRATAATGLRPVGTSPDDRVGRSGLRRPPPRNRSNRTDSWWGRAGSWAGDPGEVGTIPSTGCRVTVGRGANRAPVNSPATESAVSVHRGLGDSWTSCLGWQNTAEGRPIPGKDGGRTQKESPVGPAEPKSRQTAVQAEQPAPGPAPQGGRIGQAIGVFGLRNRLLPDAAV